MSRTTARGVISRFLERPVSEQTRFEPSKTRLAIYAIDGSFWCAPPKTERPCTGWDWTLAGKVDDRLIFRAPKPHARFS